MSNVTDQGIKIFLMDPTDLSRAVGLDNLTKALVVMSAEHTEIHEAETFTVDINSNNAAVAGLNVAFKTLAGTKLDHMLFGYSMNDEIKFEIIEGPTWTQGSGTAVDIVNVHRDDGSESTVMLEDKNQATFTASDQVIKDVTGIANGTVINTRFTYNAGLGAAVVAETRDSAHEWPLKNDTAYVVRMTQTDGNCKMSINLLWYEHTNE